jgi:hypothetical protein
MTVGRGVKEGAGFGRSSVVVLCWTCASSIDRRGGRETDRGASGRCECETRKGRVLNVKWDEEWESKLLRLKDKMKGERDRSDMFYDEGDGKGARRANTNIERMALHFPPCLLHP